jgi:hypothetical protein
VILRPGRIGLINSGAHALKAEEIEDKRSNCIIERIGQMIPKGIESPEPIIQDITEIPYRRIFPGIDWGGKKRGNILHLKSMEGLIEYDILPIIIDKVTRKGE